MRWEGSAVGLRARVVVRVVILFSATSTPTEDVSEGIERDIISACHVKHASNLKHAADASRNSVLAM
jgi:hypothetical protein